MERVQSHTLSRILRGFDLSNSDVLELGCGVGRWAPKLQKAGANYIGTDLSQGMISRARIITPSANFVHLTTDNLPFETGSFDLVLTVTVLHHNSYARQDELIDELLRITKPGGHILIMEAILPSDRTRTSTSFNMFPRPVADWISRVTLGERADLVRIKLVRFWIIRYFCLRCLGFVFRHFRKAFGKQFFNRADTASMGQNRLGVLRDLVARIDGLIDPMLASLLTERSAAAAAILFQRSSTPLDRAEISVDVEP